MVLFQQGQVQFDSFITDGITQFFHVVYYNGLLYYLTFDVFRMWSLEWPSSRWWAPLMAWCRTCTVTPKTTIPPSGLCVRLQKWVWKRSLQLPLPAPCQSSASWNLKVSIVSGLDQFTHSINTEQAFSDFLSAFCLVSRANDLACKSLDKIEKTLPILHQPSGQVRDKIGNDDNSQ